MISKGNNKPDKPNTSYIELQVYVYLLIIQIPCIDERLVQPGEFVFDVLASGQS